MLKLYKCYIYTFKTIEKLNKMTNAYNNISFKWKQKIKLQILKQQKVWV